jgi:hypothetical protein
MSYPKSFELPEPEDFCRGTFHTLSGKCCFIGWKQELFPKLTQEQNTKFIECAVGVAKEMELSQKKSWVMTNWWGGVPGYNDDRRNTSTQLAEWFRKTVERMGYDIS